MNNHDLPKLVDKQEREKIAKEINCNILVEASAGSGKTSSLIHRMVALIKSGKFKVDEIAAITFTRKAAIELKERFQQKIEKSFRETEDEKEKAYLEEALSNLEQCYLGTIHSFCARLLRERPIEAGLDPEFTELDELDDSILKEEAWERYLLNLKIEESLSLTHLEELGIKPSELVDCYKMVCTYPEVKPCFQILPKPNLKEAVKEIISFSDKASQYIPDQEPKMGYDKLQEAVLSVKRMKGFHDYIKEDYNKIKLLENFSKSEKVTLNRWTSKEKAKEYRDSLSLELQEKIINPILKQWREYCYAGTIKFVLPAVEYYHELRQKVSMLNFQDLLLKTSHLLRDYPGVRQYFQEKYKCLLVDEFQDTDPIQAEIIFYLTGRDLDEKDWQKLIPRSGSLFVVGDPQQSIYRFRRADIAIYNLVKELIKKTGGEILILQANFRSLHSIGCYLNPIFEELFSSGQGKFQATYSPMQTIRKDNPQNLSGVKQLIVSKERNKSDTIRQDAQSIARTIRDMVDKGFKLVRTEEEIKAGISTSAAYRDFMILLRHKGGMDIYASTFAEYGIPFTVSGFASLNESHQIKELLKLFRLMIDTENQILIVAVLRGIFFGFSDDDLYQFKEAGGEFDFYEKIPEKLNLRLKKNFNRAFCCLKQFHLWTQKLPPVTAVEKIIVDSGLFSHSSLQSGNLNECGELYFVLEKLRKAETGEVISFASMVDLLEKMLDAGVEEELDILTEENTVRIMNLHKAKGLESPVVFLAIPYNTTTHEPTYCIERTGQESRGHFLVYRSNPYNKGEGKRLAQPENWEDYCQLETSYDKEENIRLLYVAATRAKNLLIISSLNHKSNKNNPWLPLLKNIKEEMDVSIPEAGLPEGKAEENEKKNENEKKKEKEYLLDNYMMVQNECRQWVTNLSKGSYYEKKPTDFKDEEKHRKIKTVDVGGTDWGSAVHKIFDYLIKDDPDEQLLSLHIERALEEQGISLKRKMEVEKILQKFKGSDLYRRLKKAEFKYSEVPFTIKITPEHSLYTELVGKDSHPVILSGTIDLVFKEVDGWVVVDYKTDRPQNQKDYPKLTEVYQKQIDIYCQVWQEISG
ncbi:MAG: UvrD-helicase domain-containing protein, partial [Candidatus Caldatribacteriota bacterium]|nr:UvrD-helicase domain-containing protein [Candidatus Caldatribacteriota bacterium]